MPFEKPKIEGGPEKNNVISMEDFRNSNEKMLRAKEIMKEDFFPRNKIEKAFGIKIDPESVPEIPFSEEDLKRAKELGQFLILRVDKTANGTPLTIENMNKLLNGKIRKGGKAIFNDDGSGNIQIDSWIKTEPFAVEDTPRNIWALSGKNCIPDSWDKDYIDQTETIINYLENNVFKNREIPIKFKSAISDFKKRKTELRKILFYDWKNAANELAEIEITKLFRQTPVEAFYDFLVCFQNNGIETLRENSFHNLTSKIIRGGGMFARISNSKNKEGIVFSYFPPDGRNEKIGTFFSRIS